jgi:hypothetical protein
MELLNPQFCKRIDEANLTTEALLSEYSDNTLDSA